MKMSVWSLARQRSEFQQYHSQNHLSEVYPQDGGESQLASKLRHCHPTYGIMRHMRTLLLLSLIISTWLQTAAAIMG